MIRTIELILGLPPLSQFDAAATAMFESFTDEADPTPYANRPPRIDLEATNSPVAYGAERSSRMDFSEYDKIDDFELNEILWRAVKGPTPRSLPPSAARSPTGRRLRSPKLPAGVSFHFSPASFGCRSRTRLRRPRAAPPAWHDSAPGSPGT